MHRVLTVGVFACLLAATAPGTTFSRETTADLIVRSERVCCAIVDGQEARRDPRTGFVFTHVRLRLLEDLKGRTEGSEIELRLPGGRADGIETVAVGVPRFAQDQEAVLMLGPRNRDGFPVVLQGERGVLRLSADDEGRRCLCQPVTGLTELEGERRVTLDRFRAALRRVLRDRAAAEEGR